MGMDFCINRKYREKIATLLNVVNPSGGLDVLLVKINFIKNHEKNITEFCSRSNVTPVGL
jgi:hypothetical protein